LYVTASAGLSLELLASVLGQIDRTAPPSHLALAVLLPADTGLPAAKPPASADACPQGLPAVDEGIALGDLARDAVMPAIADLRSDITRCLGSLRLAETRVVVALRIGENGSAERACFVDNGGLDERTASCVLLVAGALQTAAPSPLGVVDLHLPLTLTTEPLAAQRGLCAP